MKVLYICRHAKSSWENSHITDFDRPLNERGEISAPIMASYLAQQALKPEHIISSTAVRALATAEVYAEHLKLDIQKVPELYHIDYMELFHYLCTLPKSCSKVAIVGHNPGLTNIINYLTGEDVYNLPTCGIAAIQFPTNNWKELSVNTGELLWLQSPKELALNS